MPIKIKPHPCLCGFSARLRIRLPHTDEPLIIEIRNTFDTPPVEPLKFIFNRKKETFLQIYCCIYKKNKLGTIHFKFQSCIIHSTCFPARDVCLCNENLSLLFTTVKASLSCHHHVLNSAAQPINAFSLKLCYHLRGTVFPDV